MKALVIILFVLGVISWGCRKDTLAPTDSECLLVERDTSLGFLNNMCFYYDEDKKFIGRAFYETKIGFTSGLPFYIPAFDSIVYVSNTKVIAYHYPSDVNSLNIQFSKDMFPIHLPNYSKKTEFLLQNTKIIRIEYYTDKTNFPTTTDSLIYEGNKLIRIYKSGAINLPNDNGYFGRKITTLDYDGNNLKSIIGVTKSISGETVGIDSTLYFSYSNLKNPQQKFTYLPNNLIASTSTNVYDSLIYNYSYNVGVSIGAGSGKSVQVYSDNGKGYPKELGLYKCD
jgi:hypothetical protein